MNNEYLEIKSYLTQLATMINMLYQQKFQLVI